MSAETEGGQEALHRLKSIDPPLYLTASPELSKTARLASQYLFSSLNPFAPKSPFTHLLTEGFDAEQIWQQIDLQSQPLVSSLRRQVRNFEKNPLEIEKQFNLDKSSGKTQHTVRKDTENKAREDVESEREDFDVDDDDDDDEGEEDGFENEDEEDDDDGDMENEEVNNVNGVEDRFLKINELEEYLEEDEAREYGLKKGKKGKKKKRGELVDDDEEGEGGEDEDEGEDEELGLLELDDEDDDDENKMENARYEDFFGRKGTGQKKKSTRHGGLQGSDMGDEPIHGDEDLKQILSTHEKEQQNLRVQIENMEKANLEPKTWTMQGEITAAKRPKNSALEVDLDFEHNVRPAPVITEEFTASIEEMIQKRVLEARFDDVQKPPDLLHKAPREKGELDENKSTKGLAEVYEDEYAQKTGLVSMGLSFSDEQKKEATMLFKKLCLKLDALSHFNFTPKPVIEDMSIQVNVPALAMEEIAPLAVSDAAMLAPEEVFAGKGDIKDETELTKADRKRRRANKKRRFKARSTKQMTMKKPQSTSVNGDDGNEDK
ncbi:M phase phosphoprotein 10-like isoform X2 [Primulina eburnea]|uniref:M phase phosphoprotein 10-like isoform X2 n=1 Tax=Primulina eburnea TaxID=1245227 RepID=UPI003C6C34FD